MNLTPEEWLKIKSWLEAYSGELKFEAENEFNWIRKEFYKEKSNYIKAFLDSKSQ